MEELGWSEGRVIAERYRLIEVIGRGGMGAVWRAEHLTLGSEVAIKQVNPRWLDTPHAIARFMREGRTVASLKTPHVVQVFDHGIDGEVPYIVMELLRGESLAERLRKVRALPAAETLRLVVHVARALTRAHEAGVVHRDLKPDNVFLVHNDDDEESAKVIDFGIAKLSHAAAGILSVDTESGALLGTAYYMSPEQARGRAVDHRTDLWALGVIAFECLTGHRPFVGETTGDVIVSICSDPIPLPSRTASVATGFDAWFVKSVSRDPAGRYQSAKEMADALKALLPTDAAAPLDAVPRAASADQPTLLAADASGAETRLAVATTAPSSRATPKTPQGPALDSDLASVSTLTDGRRARARRAWAVGAALVLVLGIATLFVIDRERRSAPLAESREAAARPTDSGSEPVLTPRVEPSRAPPVDPSSAAVARAPEVASSTPKATRASTTPRPPPAPSATNEVKPETPKKRDRLAF